MEERLLGPKEVEACLRYFAQQLQTLQASGDVDSCVRTQQLWLEYASSLSERCLWQSQIPSLDSKRGTL